MVHSRKMAVSGTRFYYFAYGSNMLKQRIVLNNPSAKYVGIGKLSDYVLKFCCCNEKSVWGANSGTATIIPQTGEHVYGAVWTLDNCDLASLDKQEGVPKFYAPIQVSVSAEDQTVLVSRNGFLFICL